MTMVIIAILIIVWIIQLPAITRGIRKGGHVPAIILLFDRLVGGASKLDGPYDRSLKEIEEYKRRYGRFPVHSHNGGRDTTRYKILSFRIAEGMYVGPDQHAFVTRYREEEEILARMQQAGKE